MRREGVLVHSPLGHYSGHSYAELLSYCDVDGGAFWIGSVGMFTATPKLLSGLSFLGLSSLACRFLNIVQVLPCLLIFYLIVTISQNYGRDVMKLVQEDSKSPESVDLPVAPGELSQWAS